MRSLRFPLALLALAAAACDDEPTNPPPEGGYYLDITISPPAVTLPLGGTVNINIVVVRGGLYPGAITLTTQGLPATILPTFNPEILTGTNDRSTLTLTSGPGSVAGPCPFVIRATGANVEAGVTPTISCFVTQ